MTEEEDKARRQELADALDRTGEGTIERRFVVEAILREKGHDPQWISDPANQEELAREAIEAWSVDRYYVGFTPYVGIRVENGKVVEVSIDWADSHQDSSMADDPTPEQAKVATDWLDAHLDQGNLWLDGLPERSNGRSEEE